MTVRIALASWPAEYGSPVGDDEPLGTTVLVDAGPEVAAERWEPQPAGAAPAVHDVWFIDGVRRMEARVWLTTDEGQTTAGLAASWAAGAIHCDGASEVTRCVVRRGLFSAIAELPQLHTRAGRFAPHRAAAPTDAGLRNALQSQMRLLERDLANDLGTTGMVLIDGRLQEPPRVTTRVVGYVKTHDAVYLPPTLQAVVARLAPGQRTPLFVIQQARWNWISWYLRLPPDVVAHPWEAIVRCEISGDTPVAEATALANQVSATLPRFASRPAHDPRAPQNLYPIGALERHLRHRLGDFALIRRYLQRAVAEAGGLIGPG